MRKGARRLLVALGLVIIGGIAAVSYDAGTLLPRRFGVRIGATHSVAEGDFDGDGVPDLIRADGRMHCWLDTSGRERSRRFDSSGICGVVGETSRALQNLIHRRHRNDFK